MPTSTPRKKAAKKISSAREFRKKKFQEVTLPSGETCLAKRPGPELFLTKGMLPDSLTPIVQQAIQSGRGLPPATTKDLAKDQESILDMLDAVDRVVAEIVVEPKVRYHKEDGRSIPESDRDEDFLYTDDVDVNDKMFLFNFAVGGSTDLERFRRELESGVGDVLPG